VDCRFWAGWTCRCPGRRLDPARRSRREELRTVALGWSAKKQILGQPVYNEKNEKVGSIDDIIVAPDSSVSYAIVGAGGFLGVGKHDIAIPASQLKQQDGKFVLPGASKEAIKALPKFEYARKSSRKTQVRKVLRLLEKQLFM